MYTSKSGCLDVRSINDTADFQETIVSWYDYFDSQLTGSER